MAATEAPMGRLYLFCGICFFMGMAYGLLLLMPAPILATLLLGGPPIAVALWLVRDGKAHGVAEVRDAGLVTYLMWPVLLPWYALRTRGRRGWLLMGLLYLLAMAGLLGGLWGMLLGDIIALAG